MLKGEYIERNGHEALQEGQLGIGRLAAPGIIYLHFLGYNDKHKIKPVGHLDGIRSMRHLRIYHVLFIWSNMPVYRIKIVGLSEYGDRLAGQRRNKAKPPPASPSYFRIYHDFSTNAI